MYHQILTLELRIPDFNRRAFSFNDFLDICNRENIAFHFWSFVPPVKGFYLNACGVRSIGVANNIEDPERLLIAFQELGHHFLGHGNGFTLETETFMAWSVEYDARLFAALAVLPTPVLEREGDEALIGWPNDFRLFRYHSYRSYLRKKEEENPERK